MKATVLPKLPKSPIKDFNKPTINAASTTIKLDAAKYLPVYQTEEAVYADLFVKTDSTIVIPHRNVEKIDCGFVIKMQPGFQAEITIKQEWAARGLVIPNSPTVISNDHEGNVFFHVINCGREVMRIEDGDAVGQITMRPIPWKFNWDKV
jgi:dUTPase